VREYEEAGVPADKIVLGVPFYEHVWGELGDQNHGLFQPGKPIPNASSNYANITGEMPHQGFVRYGMLRAPRVFSTTRRSARSFPTKMSNR
jgi:chitinase